MFNFTPPHSGNVVKGIALFFLLFFCFAVYMRGYHAGMCSSEKATTCGADGPEPVSIRKSLFFNPDSIAYYTSIAAREDDPRALFIAGMATRLSLADPDYPFSSSPIHGGTEGGLPAPSEADHYLLRAAELGYPDAVTYIRCLAAHDQWPHYLPASCR